MEAGTSRVLHPYSDQNPACICIVPQWSPDGRWIIFNEVSMNPQSEGLWVVAADGSEEHFVDESGIDSTSIWAPNSSQWIYQRAGGEDDEKYRLVEVGNWRPEPLDLETDWIDGWSTPFSLRKAPVSITPPPAPTPTAGVVPWSACSEAPPSRVEPGLLSRVTYTDGTPLAIRTKPGLSSGERIQYLAEGTRITILDGPGCADGYTWWQVETLDGVQGWVAEGDLDTYFIEPLE
jgi:hypothetical protein